MHTTNIWYTLRDIVVDLATLVTQVFSLLLGWSLLIVWIAWWLWGVNWPRFWESLRQGAWTGLVLLLVLGALVWSRIEPGSGRVLGVRLPSFWWQLGQVGLLAAFTFFLGWLQAVMGWTPPEISLEPPAHHDDGHGHAHEGAKVRLGHDTVTEPPAESHEPGH